MHDIEKIRRKRDILKMHKHKISKSSDGGYSTYVPDPVSKSGSKLLRKTYLSDLEDAIYEYYVNPIGYKEKVKFKATLKYLYP